MAMTTWGGMTDPFFNQIERAMDRAFDRTFGGRGVTDMMGMPTMGLPTTDIFRNVGVSTHPVDIFETNDSFNVTCDAPGMTPEDIKVEFDQGVLTISGEMKRMEKMEKEGKLWRNERQWNKFSRSFTLPDNTNPDGICACLDKGVLKVCVPKTEQAKTQPKRITVQGMQGQQGMQGMQGQQGQQGMQGQQVKQGRQGQQVKM